MIFFLSILLAIPAKAENLALELCEERVTYWQKAYSDLNIPTPNEIREMREELILKNNQLIAFLAIGVPKSTEAAKVEWGRSLLATDAECKAQYAERGISTVCRSPIDIGLRSDGVVVWRRRP